MDALDTTIFSQVNIEQPFMGLRMENLVRGTSPTSVTVVCWGGVMKQGRGQLTPEQKLKIHI